MMPNPAPQRPEPFDIWYSTQAAAARFVTGLEQHISERTIRREIERQPELNAAAVRKFGHVFLPWAVLGPWLGISEPPKALPWRRNETVVVEPILARSEGELTRKLGKTINGGETLAK